MSAAYSTVTGAFLLCLSLNLSMSEQHTLPITDVLLESGTVLSAVLVDFMTWGTASAQRDNIAVVIPALTGTTNAAEWWSGIVGPGCAIDTTTAYVLCPRIRFEDVATTTLVMTTLDVARIYERLLDQLGIGKVTTVIGGSMGGQIALMWAVFQPNRFRNLICIAANAKASAWGIAIRAAQRMAIEADQTFGQAVPNAGQRGLAAARAMGMVSYRTYSDYERKQAVADNHTAAYAAELYQRYQGQKLTTRFDATTYYMLTKTMDSHNVGRTMGGVDQALKRITARTLVVGIDQDVLMPNFEQRRIAKHVSDADYCEMQSAVGHDAFLADQEQLAVILNNQLSDRPLSLIT
jgi:homoserine O-acetyltransferase